MAASVVRFRSKADRIQTDQAESLRQMVLAFPDLPERAAGEIIATIDHQTAAENGWTFVMLSPQEFDRVADWLTERSHSPALAVRLWIKLFSHLRRDTGEVMQTRDELADAIGTSADQVSRIMGELESIGAISRKRTKIGGMKGPGMVRYFVNPKVGTHLTGAARDRVQAAAPLLLVPDPPTTA
jgi:hypothetical protein